VGVTKVIFAFLPKRIGLIKYLHMALPKPKPAQDKLEEFAERIAADINERAAKMTYEQRDKADAETKKIAERVTRRNP
jgi:hypothetical protein